MTSRLQVPETTVFPADTSFHSAESDIYTVLVYFDDAVFILAVLELCSVRLEILVLFYYEFCNV